MTIRSAFRLLRGGASITLAWGVLWAGIGVVLRVVAPGEPMAPTVSMLVTTASEWAVPGAVAGALFAAFLAVSGRRRISEFSLPRTAVWGALAGVLVPMSLILGGELRTFDGVSSYVLRILTVFASSGAVCAAATLALARRAPRIDSLAPTTDLRRASRALELRTSDVRDSSLYG